MNEKLLLHSFQLNEFLMDRLKKLGFVLGLSLGVICASMGSEKLSTGEDEILDETQIEEIKKYKVILEIYNHEEKNQIKRKNNQRNCCTKISEIIKRMLMVGGAVVLTKAIYDALPYEYQDEINNLVDQGICFIADVGSGVISAIEITSQIITSTVAKCYYTCLTFIGHCQHDNHGITSRTVFE